MTNLELAAKAIQISQMKTLYVLGGYGIQLNSKGKERAKAAYDYNEKRAQIIDSASADTFGFDCSGLIKGIMWGFDGTKTAVLSYGGAVYKSNKFPDWNANTIMASTVDFKYGIDEYELTIGEAVGMHGHIGIYIGDNSVVESTPNWKDGVQITKLSERGWESHGKLPYVDYSLKEKSNAGQFSAVYAELQQAISEADKAIKQANKKLQEIGNVYSSLHNIQ